jgi:hypothetical protein
MSRWLQLTLLGALLVALVAYIVWMNGQFDDGLTAATSPSPSPSPTASASVSVDPSPIPHAPAAARDEALRDELLARLEEDQAVRTGVAPPGDDRTPDELFGDMDRVDAENTARMREILEASGWPGWSLVGEDGSEAAWALVQHADLDPAFQELALAYLMGAVAADDASAGDLAYLIDRVRVAKGEPQLYGTQVTSDAAGDIVPRTPIEDPENVDARRLAAGLETLEAYYDEMARLRDAP